MKTPHFDIWTYYKGHDGHDTALDAVIRRAAAIRSSGSGYCFVNGERDISFHTNRVETAIKAVKRLRQAFRSNKRRGCVQVFDNKKNKYVRLY